MVDFPYDPKKGEFGCNIWVNGSARIYGQRWRVDAGHHRYGSGLAYLRVESATSDYYGGHRSGNGLFDETLVCADLKTGVRRWHFQLVHHGLWDMDISSAPLLMGINADGKTIKAVAQSTVYSSGSDSRRRLPRRFAGSALTSLDC